MCSFFSKNIKNNCFEIFFSQLCVDFEYISFSVYFALSFKLKSVFPLPVWWMTVHLCAWKVFEREGALSSGVLTVG